MELDPLAFQAKRINTGPTGTFRIYLLKPCSGSPGVSFKASSLTLRRYRPLATAVVISLAVYAIGLPICSVSSSASTSCFARSKSRALFTIRCRSFKLVVLYVSNARSACVGSRAMSALERPLRVRIGLLVDGDIVISCSAKSDILFWNSCKVLLLYVFVDSIDE